MSLRIIFMGSDALAVPALQRVADWADGDVRLVVTSPDRPQGRRRRMAPCPAKACAQDLGLPLWTPEKVGSADSLARMEAEAPDVFAVAAYGQFLPGPVLALARAGGVNVHPSLLPRYRGASPIQWAVANGDRETGVSIIAVAREMDAGDIYLQKKVPIGEEETAAELKERLAELGADLLVEVLNQIHLGKAHPEPQASEGVALVRKLEREDGRLDWRRSAEELRNRIRGFQPWPGAFCEWPPGEEGRLNVLAARVEAGRGAPGEVLAWDGDGPLVATGEGALRLLEVQPAGKKAMPGRAFLLGHKNAAGRTFRVTDEP